VSLRSWMRRIDSYCCRRAKEPQDADDERTDREGECIYVLDLETAPCRGIGPSEELWQAGFHRSASATSTSSGVEPFRLRAGWFGALQKGPDREIRGSLAFRGAQGIPLRRRQTQTRAASGWERPTRPRIS